MDEYLITYCCDDGTCPNPMHARGVAVLEAQDDLLMRFYLLLGRAIEATSVSRLPYWEYLNGAEPWDARVFSTAGEAPPPFMSNL
jgi:hypothetical protein